MSLAGIQSNRGDAYQRAIALNFVVKMLLDKEISGVQVDSVALPDSDELVLGDDVVVLRNDGKKNFIQAKVNQSNHSEWKLSDKILIKELISAYEQLSSDDNCEFHFYSRTPFGPFQRLIEEVRLYPNCASFMRGVGQNQKNTLSKITQIWELDDDLYTFDVCQRIYIGDHHSVNGWVEYSGELLKLNFSRSNTALDLLWSYVDKQHSKLGAPQYVIDRVAVLEMLESHGIYHALGFDEKELIGKFRTFSLQGRQWVRTIGDDVLPRPALDKLIMAVRTKVSSVLLEDVAGGGKTCVLLDLMDYLDKQDEVAVLFIRGDLYSSIKSLSDLSQYGLPDNLVAQSARLAEHRQLVVVIDSLDVLAVGRSHQALKSFLGLVAALSAVPNITVIAASRSFDAKYDPLLRETEWSMRVGIAQLSYDDEISPLLKKWGVNPESVSLELKQLILVPQNLRLFYMLVQKGVDVSDIEGHDLYDFYIREIVEQDEALGTGVVTVLENIASNLLDRRGYIFSKNQLKLEGAIIQRLLSSQVLMEVNAFEVMFSHQTLADALRIRLAQNSGTSLLEFVTSQSQFPFVRPAVRAFIQRLRLEQSDVFVRQVWQLIQSKEVATHIKRLVVETIAEMHPNGNDLVIIMRLSIKYPALFMRLLGAAKSGEWFLFLYAQWLPAFNAPEDDVVLGRFLNYSSQFKNDHPEILVELWLLALNKQWLPSQNLAWNIANSLRDFEGWNVNGIGDLLDRLVDASGRDRDGVGRAISQYVEETGRGDKLLWRFITRDVVPVDEAQYGRQLILHCDSHEFHNDDFLEDRLKYSDKLFGLVFEYVEQFGKKCELMDGRAFTSALLNDTSWKRRHSSGNRSSQSSMQVFLGAFESAMKFRASNNDDCWRFYEPRIRDTCELGIRCILCQSYTCNVEENIDGISSQLTDKELLKSGRMDYELGILSSKAYPYLSDDIQENHQKLLLRLYEEEGKKEFKIWGEQNIYEYLIWIPAPFRLEGVVEFFERASSRFGLYRPRPYMSPSGGFVASPVSEEQMLKLDVDTLAKLLFHYNDYNNHYSDRGSGGLTGGRESLGRALNNAASWNPDYFIPLIPLIDRYDLAETYIASIIDGVAVHLNARFGNCHYSGWKEIKPLPDGNELALKLLSLVERYGDLKGLEHEVKRAVEACCHVLTDDRSIDRLCFQLWKMSLSNSPEPDEDDAAQSLIGNGINSVRGVAAECVLIICNNLLEQGRVITDELRQLLERYAKDKSMAVRATFLRRFPYFLSREQELGWHLVSLIVKSGKPRIWKHLEQSLYWQYHNNFNLVSPYLNGLRLIEDDKSAESWGRLATLSYLVGHIDEDELFKDIGAFQSKGVFKGVAVVFTHNIEDIKNRKICVQGLIRLMGLDAPESVYSELGFALNDSKREKFIPAELIDLYISQAPANSLNDVHGVFDWMANNVVYDAGVTLRFLERLILRLSDFRKEHYFYKPESLIVTIKLLLQEADTSDDELFIERVLTVQDWFLEQAVEGLQGLLEAY